MKKIKFTFDNTAVEMEANTHAALFRAFFDWWKENSMESTVYGLLNSELRLSTEPVFERNVIKKNNYEVVENELYIITHITPKAMEDGITRFLTSLNHKEYEADGKKIDLEYDDSAEELAFDDNDKMIDSVVDGLTNKPKNKKKYSIAELVELKMEERDSTIRSNVGRNAQQNLNGGGTQSDVKVKETEIDDSADDDEKDDNEKSNNNRKSN